MAYIVLTKFDAGGAAIWAVFNSRALAEAFIARDLDGWMMEIEEHPVLSELPPK